MDPSTSSAAGVRAPSRGRRTMWGIGIILLTGVLAIAAVTRPESPDSGVPPVSTVSPDTTVATVEDDPEPAPPADFDTVLAIHRSSRLDHDECRSEFEQTVGEVTSIRTPFYFC